MSSPDYIIDIDGVEHPAHKSSGDTDSAKAAGRPWLSVRWRCCETYSRIYRNDQGTGYRGHCPKCGKPVRVTVGPGGTSERFFEAY